MLFRSAGERRGLALSGAGFLLTGIAATAAQFDPFLGWASRLLPLDRERQVHRLALVLSLVLVLTQLITQLSTDVLDTQASSGKSLSRLDLVLQELPFLFAALAGVGLSVRRGPGDTLARLGLVRPRPEQILVALAAAGVFYAFGVGMDHLGQALTPDLSRRVQAATDRLFAHLTDPLGVITIALAAGVCEEVLFRGAMQPRLGLVWVAVVFASVHTQYGLSVDTAAVLILAGGLGLIRRFANTTTSMLCHVAYNTLVGFGVGWIGVLPAVGVEMALLAAATLAVLRVRSHSRSGAALTRS